MLDPDIDVPLERIYVPPSIKELKRGRKDRPGRGEMDTTSRAEPDVSCYRELLHRYGDPVNTIYIQGDPGCGKTTFSTKLVLDWCKAHSKNGASCLETLTRTATTTGKTSNPTYFSDLDTLRDYTFLFFVSLRDYSGTMCNVSQMVEDAIKSIKLPWDDSVWEHKCIVLTDAADEWYHPEIAFPPPRDSACNCHKYRSMPQYLQRNNISNIITARPWKLANLIMSDTLTRLFEISGVTNYTTLAENVITVLAEKDGISKNDQQCKCIDIIEAQSLGNLITVPAVCVQLVHQFYVGRLVEGSRCSVYMNMLDMHIAKGLQKLQIENFDTEEMCVNEIKQIIGTESTEYLRDNWSLVHSACALAFKTLTDTSKESSLVFAENTITNHMTKTKLYYLLQTGIITKKKSLALSSRKNVPYMFLHKTIQEFLASLYIAMNQPDIENTLNTIQSVYCDYRSILDIGQLFIFTCGMCAPAAERISKHITDVITCVLESKPTSYSDRDTILFQNTTAQNIIVDGFIEGLANKQSCLRLTISHIDFFNWKNEKYKYALNTLIDMNISNIISIEAVFFHTSQQESPHRLQEIISQSRETLSYLRLWLKNTDQLDLQGLKLKYLSCSGNTDISNLDCTFMRACEITFLSRLSEDRILQSMSVTGKNIRRLELSFPNSMDLLCAALPNLTSLHTFILKYTPLKVTQHYQLSESIRKLVYQRIKVSTQDIKSMVEWSKSRDACVCCKLLECDIFDNAMEICHWMKQQDGIDITQCEIKQLSSNGQISLSWSTILSK
ncbi:hypothetical protein DPMN_188720 [Dreissena polymorpha]|uniref:NACHT domain-containing protein n=1 Tax=Dreissena polymorpha TaxID=45954 RepID=A0A9D4I8T0_DREPO|nr:hypothetical protein DPMN_188720 [Dreissena polymorpha]